MVQQRASLGWIGVAIAAILMILCSGLILYPIVTDDNILTALRVSSVTTALPFLLVFTAQPLARLTVGRGLGTWAQTNRRYLWLILTASHLLHLAQIALYYRQGQSCPWTVWAVTSPLWIIMVAFSGVEWVKPQQIDQVVTAAKSPLTLLYWLGNWYIWLVFALAFGLGAIGKHLVFYNLPAFVLFLAAAFIHGLARWSRR